jgi:hypothetical protein
MFNVAGFGFWKITNKLLHSVFDIRYFLVYGLKLFIYQKKSQFFYNLHKFSNENILF